jgi:hypothetical protein
VSCAQPGQPATAKINIYRRLRYLRCRSGHWRRRSMKLRTLKGAPTVGAVVGGGSLASWAGPNQSGEERRGPILRRSREEGWGGVGDSGGRRGAGQGRRAPGGRGSRWTREAGTGRGWQFSAMERTGTAMERTGRHWRRPGHDRLDVPPPNPSST